VEENDCYCPLLTDNLLENPPAASQVQTSFECNLLSTQENNIETILYPNPTADIINISIQENVSYQVFSAVGQLLLSGELSGNAKQIDLSSLAANLYYVRIKNETFKIVKTK
ncbi:MAG: hypothetical protein ACI849_001741, partial [Patiriisocius sp.]